ncbi:MAG: hypothetical protein LBE83_00515 [Propionibacteriaceae bacterium]|jgi:hypothetical protein|nr:hypothetical protein [Propionibacteriaceae bacterium]
MKLQMMTRLVRTELAKLRLPVTLTITLLTVGTIILTGVLYTDYSLAYDLEAWEVGTALVSFLFPVFVVVPICWTAYFERRNGFLAYVIPRVPPRRYLAAKWIAAALSALGIMVIPYLASALFALYVKPAITPFERASFDHIFLTAFTQTPLAYACLLSLWRGVIAVLVMSLGFVFSLYVRNIFVILTGPFIYAILENFVFAILGVPQYRLVTSFDPTVVVVDSLWSLAVGPGLLCAVIAVTWLAFAVIKREPVFKV